MSRFVVGLTGQTGAGKSLVSRLLEEKNICSIDCDLLAREIVLPGTPALAELKKIFGNGIIAENGELNRTALAEKAFSSSENAKALNRITHPGITELALKRIDELAGNGCRAIVLNAALLIDSPLAAYCEIIAAVVAPLETRLERIIERDNLSRERAMKRINAQPAEEYYKQNCDIIINNYPPFLLEQQVELLAAEIEKRAEKKRQSERNKD